MPRRDWDTLQGHNLARMGADLHRQSIKFIGEDTFNVIT